MATGNQTPTNKWKEKVSDAKKLADKHLADPNHIITDEDLAKIRVGVSSEPDAPTQQAVSEAENSVADI